MSDDHIKQFNEEKFIQDHQDLPYALLAARMAEVKADLDTRKKGVAVAQKKFDAIRLKILPDRMVEDEMQSIKISGVGRLSLTNDAYVSVAAGNRAALHVWLKDHGFAEVIQPTVTSSTLKAFIKEQIREGNPTPGEGVINYTPFLRASLTKS